MGKFVEKVKREKEDLEKQVKIFRKATTDELIAEWGVLATIEQELDLYKQVFPSEVAQRIIIGIACSRSLVGQELYIRHVNNGEDIEKWLN